jgi:hypothetical protein
MNRSRVRNWTLWLLPLLVARAFLPVGFMLSANADGLQLVFCAGQAPTPVQALNTDATTAHAGHGVDHAQHHQMQHAQSAADEHATHHGGSQLDPPCPYAIAAVAIAADIPPLAPESLSFTNEAIEQRAQWFASAGPVRADRIRGPPSLS